MHGEADLPDKASYITEIGEPNNAKGWIHFYDEQPALE
jgi:hypothetical protein